MKILEHWNPMLDAIKQLCPTAHIAGGAVRDTQLERPVRDIDLFLDDAVADEAAKLMRSKFGYVKVGQWASYLNFSDPIVIRLAKFEKWDEEIPVCLIGLDRPRGMQDNVSRFDFGICMAAWNGEVVYTDRKYRYDLETKRFTLCRADNAEQFAYSMQRYKKMTADRYGGWELVVPKEFEALAREYTFRKSWYSDHYTGDFGLKDNWLLGKEQLKPKAR